MLQSSSSFSLVTTTLLRWMPTRTVGPLAPSPCTHSMETAYFFLQTWTTPPLWTFVLPSYNLNFIVPLTVHRSTIILLSQLFRQERKHHLPPNVRRWTETPFSVLASVRNHQGVELHFDSCVSQTVANRKRSACQYLPSNTSPPSAHLSLSVYLLLGDAPVHVLLDSLRGAYFLLKTWCQEDKGGEEKGDLYPGTAYWHCCLSCRHRW